jgi:hypothetical protein
MATYRKKPVVIEAEQWAGDFKDMKRICEIFYGMQTTARSSNEGDNHVGFWKIGTLEGSHVVSKGDWIIKGIKGEFYPCKPDIFEATYEKVGD